MERYVNLKVGLICGSIVAILFIGQNMTLLNWQKYLLAGAIVLIGVGIYFGFKKK